MDRVSTSPAPDRRQFARLGAAAFAAMAGSAALPDRATAQGRNAPANLFPNLNARQFRDILQNENDHLVAVTAMIRMLGGTPRPKPNFQNLTAPNPLVFASMSQVFEQVGAGAGPGAAPSIFSKQVLSAALSINVIEARQAGWLNTLFNFEVSRNVFGEDVSLERALTQQEVVTLATPFIRDLNNGPPPSFNATPSRANDLNILNFILLIEQFEGEFYNINVPRFFPA